MAGEDMGVTITRACHELHPELRFSTVMALGLRQSDLKRLLQARDADDLRDLQARSATLDARAACGSRFFAAAGFTFPLQDQIRRATDQGFGEAPVLVKALLRCELLNGVLMGVQDADAMVMPITLDRGSSEGEVFEGMRGPVTCGANDLVVRDGDGIVAAVFQGPDKRTQVSKSSVNVVFYVFDAPGLGSAFDDAEALAMELLTPCAELVRVTRATVAD